MDNLEAQTYETFERDSIKYIQVCCVCLFYFLHILNSKTSLFLTTPFCFCFGQQKGGDQDDFVIQFILIFCLVGSFFMPNFCPSFCCQYQRAVAKALVDRVPDDKASELTTVCYMSMFYFRSLHMAFAFISFFLEQYKVPQ